MRGSSWAPATIALVLLGAFLGYFSDTPWPNAASAGPRPFPPGLATDDRMDPATAASLTASGPPALELEPPFRYSAAASETPTDAPPSSGRPRPLSVNSTEMFNITISTVPPNLDALVDNETKMTPLALQWTNGSVHTVAPVSPQIQGSTSRVFEKWFDGASEVRTITVGAPLDLVASFLTQYLVTIQAEPVETDIKVDAIPFSTPYVSWWLEGSTHEVGAFGNGTDPVGGLRRGFDGWSDQGAMQHDVIATGPVSLTIRVKVNYLLFLDVPNGTAACNYPGCWYDSGALASFGLESPPVVTVNSGMRDVFRGWAYTANRSAVTSPILMDGSKNVSATWVRQYNLSIDAGPGQVTGGGWYDTGSWATAGIESTIVPDRDGHWRFGGWKGAGNASEPQFAVLMDGPKNLSATWEFVPAGAVTVPTGNYAIVAVISMALVGAAVVSTPRGEYALAGLGVPLFTRLRKEQVRNQFTRGRLLQFIEDNPGAGYTQVRRKLSLSNGACAYHLRVLERNGDLRRVVRGASVRFYSAGYKFDAEALPPLAYFQRRILETLVQAGSATFGEISAALAARGLQVTDTNLGYHLNVLAREKQLISTRREDRKTVYFVDGERRDYLRRRLQEERGMDEAMDMAALTGADLAVGDLDPVRSEGATQVMVSLEPSKESAGPPAGNDPGRDPGEPR